MYTRVFESILDSSINVQRVPPSARWLWITMLLIADRNRTGIVDMPVERLAARAGLTVDQALEGLALLSAPDIESSSPDEDGRRIIPIREDATRGWKLVNWEKYKSIASEEQQREQTRRRVAEFRAKKKRDVTDGNDPNVTCNTSEAEAPSEADANQSKEEAPPERVSRSRKRPTTAEVIASIEEFAPNDEQRLWAAQNAPSVPIEKATELWKDRLRENGYRTKQGPVMNAAASWRKHLSNDEAWGTYTKGNGNGGRRDGQRQEGQPRKTPRDFGARDGREVFRELQAAGKVPPLPKGSS